MVQAQDTTAAEATGTRAELLTIGSPADDDLRTMQLLGGSTAGQLLRSPSSLMAAHGGDARFTLAPPQLRIVANSAMPYSLNDGAMWAGRGTSAQVTFGATARIGRVRIALLPEVVWSANDGYPLADTTISPAVPATRHPYSSPWHAGAQSVDLPIRFGDAPLSRLTPGQSALVVNLDHVDIGVATENEWWGPGIRNALLLTNAAEGFPHLLVRTAKPVATPFGDIEARWLAGGLTESDFFDFDSDNDLRSIALLGVTLQPRGADGLTVGLARAVYGRAGGRGAALASFPDVFRDVGQPNAVPASDSVPTNGKDQLISMFARWVFPRSGFEAYGELGRAELPASLRDFLEQPKHSRAYVAGVQWLSREMPRVGRVRVQLETAYLEQTSTYRFRPIGSWYTSHAAPQGYTQRGQPLGAAIGPGSSSQWVAVDVMRPAWQLGASFSRIRWLEDAHSQMKFLDGRCTHDVSLLPGVRGQLRTRLGTAFAEYSSGWRLNRWFEADVCAPAQDVRNNSLSIGFSPRLWTRRARPVPVPPPVAGEAQQ